MISFFFCKKFIIELVRNFSTLIGVLAGSVSFQFCGYTLVLALYRFFITYYSCKLEVCKYLLELLDCKITTYDILLFKYNRTTHAYPRDEWTDEGFKRYRKWTKFIKDSCDTSNEISWASFEAYIEQARLVEEQKQVELCYKRFRFYCAVFSLGLSVTFWIGRAVYYSVYI